jgi:hypothetical protein
MEGNILNPRIACFAAVDGAGMHQTLSPTDNTPTPQSCMLQAGLLGRTVLI